MAESLFPEFDVPELEELEDEEDLYEQKPSVYFDFEAGDFRQTKSHNIAQASEEEAFIQWCRKAVMTERDAALAYSSDIGIESEEALQEEDREAVEAELEKTITEALMVHPATEYVNNFEFEWGPDSIHISFLVKGKPWEEEEEVEIEIDD
ncbi:MAG: DUF2634 domain-containing protein [Ruminococcus sp.]